MKGPQKSNLSQDQEQAAPTPPAGAPAPTPKAADPASSSGGTSAGETDERVAVLSLSMVGEIIAARQACRPLFGREAALLVGQNIRVLLKEGLDNEVGHFLLKYQTGESAGGTSMLNVIALRKDGTEFPARVTTQTWSWDKDVAKKGDTSSRTWTAIFRDLSEPPPTANPQETAPSQEPQAVSEPAEAEEEAAPSAEKAPEAPIIRGIPAGQTVTPPPDEVIPFPSRLEFEQPEPPVPAPALAPTPTPAPAPVIVKDLEGVAVELSRRFEEQLATLRQEKEDLKSKLQELGGRAPGTPAGAGGTKGEAELRAQLDKAKEAVSYAHASLKEEIARREKLEEQLKSGNPSQARAESSRSLDPQLSILKREREELKRNLATQQKAAEEATRRAAELEARFGEASTEYERVKSELAGLNVARDRSQAELRQQLADAQAVKASLEASLGETLARHNSHEAELAKLRREHAELTSKLAAEQLAAAQAQLAGDPKGRTTRNAPDAKRLNAELEKLSAERKRAEAQWREQLDAANAIKARLEASLNEALERQRQFEQEVAKLRQERDDLQIGLTAQQAAAAQLKKRVEEFEAQSRKFTGDQDPNKLAAEVARLRQERDDFQARLTAEQQVAAQFQKQVEEFEAQSRKITGDLGQAKAQAEKQERAHFELRSQLEAAKEAAGFADASLKEEVARRQKLEAQLQALDSRLKQEHAEGNKRHGEELNSLRKECEELNKKLEAQQKAATEATQRAEELAGRISQDAANTERARTELEVQNAERERDKEDMRVELAGAHAARTRLESSLGEALERGNRFEAEATQLRREQEDLNSKLAAEQRALMEAKRRAEQLDKEAASVGQAALKKEIARREQLEQRLKTLTSGLKEEQAERKKRFDKELSSLRTERDALDAKLASEQKEASGSTRRTEELERRLSQNAAEFERAKTELEQLTAERERSETVWREQLDTAFIAKKELAGAWAGAVEQNKKLEEELAKLRREQEELHGKLTAEQQVAAQSKDRASDVESLLSRNASESERIRAELDQQNAEMERRQAEWREQLEAAEAVKASLESSLEEARERSKQFEGELAALQQERDGLQGKLSAEQQAAAESNRRAREAEGRLGQRATELDRVNAELEKQRAKLEQSEANWRKQLEAAQSKKVESGKGSRNEVAALRRERDDLQAKLTAELQAAAESTRRANEAEIQVNEREVELERLNAELEQQRANLEESEVKWHKQLEAAQVKKTEPSKTAGAELAALRRERDDLHAQLAAELQAAGESRRFAEEAQIRLNQGEAELDRLNAELKRQATNLEHAESRFRKQSEAAQAQKAESQKILAAADDCNRRLEKELAELRLKYDRLSSKSKSEAQPVAKPAPRPVPAPSRPAPTPARFERTQPQPQDDPWQYPAQVQDYQFDFPKPQPVRRTRAAGEPARRRRQHH